ncbi:MAG: DUF3310 domain-containing protein [Desulfobacteraceae bacterium]|nr:DUF3310 domain-containing protein [Desulfobacteraceae bacterium]
MRKDYEKIDYYNVGIECIEVIEALHLHFSAGNAFKYLYRSNNVRPKGEVLHDLNKTIYYLNRMLHKPRLNADSNTLKYIKLIDQEMFSCRIFSAIENTLQAGTSSNLNSYRLYIQDAILDIETEINEDY